MHKQQLLPHILPKHEPKNADPRMRYMTGKQGVANEIAFLMRNNVETIMAQEGAPYDYIAICEAEDAFKRKLKFLVTDQSKSHEFADRPHCFRTTKGRLYKPHAFHIHSCSILDSKTAIWGAGVPKKSIKHKSRLFYDPEYCISTWDNAVQEYLNQLSKQFGGNRELKYVRQ